MKVLVIHITSDENKMAVVDMTDCEYKYFSQANGYIVNFSEFDEVKDSVVGVIDYALDINPNHRIHCPTDKEREYFGRWSSNIKTSLSDLSDIDKLITTEFAF